MVEKQDRTLADRVLASEGFQGRAIIFGNRFKYIRSYEPTQKKIYPPSGFFSRPTLFFAKEQLYDLEMDPAEERNLATLDGDLISQARSLYGTTFGIKDGFELVIESPDGAEVKGEFEPDTKLDVRYGEAAVSKNGGRVLLKSSGQSTLVLKIKHWDPKTSWLRIGDQPVTIKRTSLRLPAHTEVLDGLPLESGGHESLIPYPKEVSAYIRRVEESGREERKIRITNPAFESVLRDWGYLNDR
jgi:hypothetical protein